MAGSYRHIVDSKNNFKGTELIENLRDSHQALEECQWMITYLAQGNLGKIFEAHRAYVASLSGFNNPDYAKEMTAKDFWREDE